jgi:hypothetical protein
MKQITSNQRTINIISKAVALGYRFFESETIEDTRIEAEQYLIDNTDAIEDQCEVVSLGGHGQRVDWSDGKGYDFWQQGDIVDFARHWHKEPEHKVYHNTVIDSEGQVVKLFYYVGQTDFNRG